MKKVNVIVLLVGLLFNLGIGGSASAQTVKADHSTWDTLLQKYVSNNGVVNYGQWKKEEATLNTYINMLNSNTPKEAWSDKEKLSFWINLYNASTIALILENYPLKSIRDIGEPWDIVFITASDKKYSLNDIEHNIIRKEFDEPRIHFALVCAAKSCPPLLNEAYTADRVEEQLQQQGVKFINNQKKNKITANGIEISKLFDWYKGDFTKTGNLISFLNNFSKINIAPGATISFMDYDWSLNE